MLSCLWFLHRSVLPSHLLQFCPARGRVSSARDEPGWERAPRKLPASQGAGSQGGWCGLHPPKQTTQEIALKKQTLCRVCSQLPRVPPSGCLDTGHTASYLEEEGFKLSACRHIQPTHFLDLPSQLDILKRKGSRLGRAKSLTIFPWHLSAQDLKVNKPVTK